MTARFVALRAPMPLLAWWNGKSSRERWFVAVLVGSLAAAVAWIALWEPLQRDIARTRGAVEREQRLLAEARQDVDEITQLQRAPLPAPADPAAALQRALETSGLRSAATAVRWQEGRAQVTFAAVDFNRLISLLQTLHRDAGLVLIDATLSARVEPGLVRAELVLGR